MSYNSTSYLNVYKKYNNFFNQHIFETTNVSSNVRSTKVTRNIHNISVECRPTVDQLQLRI